MSVEPALPSRKSVIAELAIVAALAAGFVAFFSGRPGYVDVVLGVLAVALIGASTGRSRALWRHAPVPPAIGWRAGVAPIGGSRAGGVAAIGSRAGVAPAVGSGGSAAPAVGSGDGAHSAQLRRASDLRSAWRGVGAFTAAGAGLFLVAGGALAYSSGGWPEVARRLGNWHLPVACALYFPWALLQQFVFQFYLLGRLLWLMPYALGVALAALAFAMVHFPRMPVMALTLAAGVVWAMSYSRHRTLWPLAASHAVLGSTLHYWLFGRDLAVLWGAA